LLVWQERVGRRCSWLWGAEVKLEMSKDSRSVFGGVGRVLKSALPCHIMLNETKELVVFA